MTPGVGVQGCVQQSPSLCGALVWARTDLGPEPPVLASREGGGFGGWGGVRVGWTPGMGPFQVKAPWWLRDKEASLAVPWGAGLYTVSLGVPGSSSRGHQAFPCAFPGKACAGNYGIVLLCHVVASRAYLELIELIMHRLQPFRGLYPASCPLGPRHSCR